MDELVDKNLYKSIYNLNQIMKQFGHFDLVDGIAYYNGYGSYVRCEYNEFDCLKELGSLYIISDDSKLNVSDSDDEEEFESNNSLFKAIGKLSPKEITYKDKSLLHNDIVVFNNIKDSDMIYSTLFNRAINEMGDELGYEFNF